MQENFKHCLRIFFTSVLFPLFLDEKVFFTADFTFSCMFLFFLASVFFPPFYANFREFVEIFSLLTQFVWLLFLINKKKWGGGGTLFYTDIHTTCASKCYQLYLCDEQVWSGSDSIEWRRRRKTSLSDLGEHSTLSPAQREVFCKNSIPGF